MLIAAEMHDDRRAGEPEQFYTIDCAKGFLGRIKIRANHHDVGRLKIDNWLMAHVAQRDVEECFSIAAAK